MFIHMSYCKWTGGLSEPELFSHTMSPQAHSDVTDTQSSPRPTLINKCTCLTSCRQRLEKASVCEVVKTFRCLYGPQYFSVACRGTEWKTYFEPDEHIEQKL